MHSLNYNIAAGSCDVASRQKQSSVSIDGVKEFCCVSEVMPTLASQTPFTAVFCSALLCVGCCCINNTLRADQKERASEREREDERGNNGRKAMVRERGGAGDAWGKQSGR